MKFRIACIVVTMLGLISVTARSQVNVTTYHADNSRSGQYTQESILTPANVNSAQFGRLFTTNLDGRVYAQPLYLSNVTIAGGTHNVLYVATEHDSVYAIDADGGSVYWQISLIPTGGSTVNSSSDLGCSDLVPEVGITGTPVIDTSTGTLYVVAKSKVAGSFVQYLHAIDVVTATEKFGGPTLIQANVNGTASDGVGGVVTFSPLHENQRAALLLENGHVIISWSSHCDISPWHGWVMSYSASTLAQEGVFNSSPNGYANGVWMSANGPAADSAGNLYFATGNGSWNGTTDYGDSIVKVGPPSGGSFPLVDYFTPYNQATLSSEDLDLASGGPVLLPPLANGKQLLALQAKTGTIYLVNTGNMGKYCPNQTPPCTNSDPQIVQELVGASVGVWGSPAYWNGSVYWGPSNDNTLAADYIRAYSFNAGGSGLLSTTPTSSSANQFGFSSPIPVVSANGSTSGILWAVDNEKYQDACTGTVNCQALYAYDATNLNSMLYNSYQAAGYRDVPGGAVKFATPIVANGKVYFGSQGSVSAFGLLAASAPPSPTFSPAGGGYSGTQTVTLSDTTSGATIYYTTNGTAPTTSSAVYSTPLTVSTTATIEAIAVAGGSAASPVASATYTISAAGAPVGVPLTASANIDAIGTDGAATLNGGLDGSGNAYSGTLLGTSVTWSGVTFTLNASGAADGVSNKALTVPAGSYQTMYLLGTGVNGNQPNQSFVVTYTDGTTSTYTQSLSDWYTPQSYPGEAIAVAMPYRLTSTGAEDNRPFYLYGYAFALNGSKTVASVTLPASRNVVVLAIELLPAGATTALPTFSPAGGTYSAAQTVTLADATSGATIYYTTNGATPTTASSVYSAPLTVSATTTIKALAASSGAASSSVASATYTISVAPPSPTFSPAGGTYGAPQTVTLSDTTSGATIYYTTNGTTPTTASTVYGAPLTVNTTTTIKAIAVTGGSAASPVASATYTISTSGSPVGVPLAAVANIDAIGTDGTATLNGGLDGGGYAYSGTLLGTSVTWSGVSFTLNASGSANGVSNRAITLPAGSYQTLYLLGTGVNGNQGSQSFVVTYTDGTTSTYTQSLSDWHTPQSYSGEATAVTMAYRLTSTGAEDNRSFYLYGYAFALNGSKTVASVTLPANRNVVVLAIELLPSGPTTAIPTFSPAGGTYSAAQTVTLADATSGATIYYTTNGTTPTTSSTVYSAPLTVSATTTIQALAASSGATSSAVTSATYTIVLPGSIVSVPLATVGNLYGIGNNGTAVPGTGIDGSGHAYSETLIGTSATWSGVPFSFAGADALDVIANTTVALPAGSFSKLYLLATGVNGNQANQTFVFTYTDGTTSSAVQSFSDWYTPQNFAGESVAFADAYRLQPSGATDNRTFNLYGYALPTNNAKVLASVTLPKNNDVVILAITLSP